MYSHLVMEVACGSVCGEGYIVDVGLLKGKAKERGGVRTWGVAAWMASTLAVSSSSAVAIVAEELCRQTDSDRDHLELAIAAGFLRK